MNLLRRGLIGGLPTCLLITAMLSAGRMTAPAQPPAAGAVPSQTTLPPENPPNEISIVAVVPTAYASAGIPGKFMLQRVGGNPLEDLTVSYRVGGEAVAGQDYRALPGTLTFPAGQSKVDLKVKPLDVAGSGGTAKGVRVTLLPSDGYSISGAAKAKVKIVQ